MRKAYILIFSDDLGSREVLKKHLDDMPEVLDWRYDMTNAFYVISEKSAQELYNSLKGRLTSNGRFLITEVSDNRQGWLTEESWLLLRHKERQKK